MTEKAGGSPQLPVGPGRAARIDAIAQWYEEMIALDNIEPSRAARRAIDAAMPPDGATPPLPVASKVILGIIAIVALALLIPVVMYVIGHGIVPLWHWGTAWLS